MGCGLDHDGGGGRVWGRYALMVVCGVGGGLRGFAVSE